MADALCCGDPRLCDGADEQLPDRLYAWYINATPLPVRTGEVTPIDVDMAAALRAAHWGAERYEGGWKAESVSTRGRVVARRGDLTRVLTRGEYVAAAGPLRHAAPGDALIVAACWDWTDDATGYWYTRRGEWPPPGARTLRRVYWNCAPADAPHVVSRITGLLGPLVEHPYTLKTPASAEHNGRADAIVLYLGPNSCDRLEPAISSTAHELADRLRDVVPRFTRRIAPGVAISESAPDGESFGQARCELLAETYLAAGPAQRRSAARLLQAFRVALEERGLDPANPHLHAARVP